MSFSNLIRLFFMCEIEGLTRECGAATPGISKLYVVDTHDVVSVPLPNSAWTIVSSIILKPGKFWKDIPFVEQKAGLSDEIADAVGGGFKKNLPIKLPKYSAQTNKWVNNAIGARFLAVVVDNNDQMILVGNLAAAMRLEKATGTTGQKSGDENGWDLNLTAEGVKPCYFYTGAVLLADGPDEPGTVDDYDTTIDFTSAAYQTDAIGGIGAIISAPSSVIKLRYKKITPQTMLGARMDLKIGSTEFMGVDGTLDYVGKNFEVTTADGVVHTVQYADGDVPVL